MKISEFIRKKREELGISQERLSKMLGYKSPMSISNIETGKSPFPSRRVGDFAFALEVEVDKLNELLYLEKVTEIGRNLKVSTDGSKGGGIEVVSSERLRRAQKVPVIGLVEGGPSHEWDDEGYPVGEGRYRLPKPTDVDDENAFGLEINGESMSPKFEPGDVVIVSPAKQVFSGDYAVCRLSNGDSMVKKIRFKGEEVLLESVNPSYPPMILPRNQLTFCYKIVWIKPKQ